MENKICGIYAITNTINGNTYVGQSCDIYHRFSQHKYLLRNSTHFSRHLQSSWDKYGECSFSFSIIKECSADTLTINEQMLIDQEHPKYNSEKPVVSSNLGHKFSIESRKRMSEAKKNPSEETRKKLSISHLGKKQSKETIEKRLANRSGIRYSDEYKKEKYGSRRGRPVSQETKDKISKSVKLGWELSDHSKRSGENNPNFGKVVSEEMKNKISVANKGRKLSEEAKQKISVAVRNRKVSDETKLKRSISMKKHYQEKRDLELANDMMKSGEFKWSI